MQQVATLFRTLEPDTKPDYSNKRSEAIRPIVDAIQARQTAERRRLAKFNKKPKYRQLTTAMICQKMSHVCIEDLYWFHNELSQKKNYISYWRWSLDVKNCL